MTQIGGFLPSLPEDFPITTPPPSEPALPVDNVGQLLTNALTDAGIIGVDEAPENPILNRAFRQANWLIAQWARLRFLCYKLQDYAFVSTGAQTYTVGLNQTININPRPDRIEYAFVRFLTQTTTTPVDIPLDVIQSHEGYSRITVKNIGTLPWRIFYDPAWPIGVLFPWPVPQPTIYELHIGFKVVLPRFSSLQQVINFPPEYEAALNWGLARRLRATYQMPPDATIDALARGAVNVIRLANTQVPVLRMPVALRTNNRAYSYQSDDVSD